MKGSKYVFLVTCEHGGNQVPPEFRKLFRDSRSLLDSHRGWDIGAYYVATKLAEDLQARLFHSNITRLLIDLNRSPHHRQLYSEITGKLPVKLTEKIFKKYYQPYRSKVELWIRNKINRGKGIIHISSHSFTPVLNGKTRSADIGLLYDPERKAETEYCRKLKRLLLEQAAGLNIRRNYPYRGNADGFTTYLRRQFSGDDYLGIELEINQILTGKKDKTFPRLLDMLVKSIMLVQDDCI